TSSPRLSPCCTKADPHIYPLPPLGLVELYWPMAAALYIPLTELSIKEGDEKASLKEILLIGLRSKTVSSEHDVTPRPIRDRVRNLNIFFIVWNYKLTFKPMDNTLDLGVPLISTPLDSISGLSPL